MDNKDAILEWFVSWHNTMVMAKPELYTYEARHQFDLFPEDDPLRVSYERFGVEIANFVRKLLAGYSDPDLALEGFCRDNPQFADILYHHRPFLTGDDFREPYKVLPDEVIEFLENMKKP